jgi:uncharacterized membrane protein
MEIGCKSLYCLLKIKYHEHWRNKNDNRVWIYLLQYKYDNIILFVWNIINIIFLLAKLKLNGSTWQKHLKYNLIIRSSWWKLWASIVSCIVAVTN